MGYAYKPKAKLAANYEIQIAGPFDVRTVVNTKDNLLDGATFSFRWFKGMVVSVVNDEVAENNGFYLLKDVDTVKWVKLAEEGQASGGGLKIRVLDTRPEVGEEGTLYLIKNTDASDENLYDEYLYENGAWERVGGIALDLSNYYTKEEVDGLIKNFITLDALNEALSGYVKSDDLDSSVSTIIEEKIAAGEIVTVDELSKVENKIPDVSNLSEKDHHHDNIYIKQSELDDAVSQSLAIAKDSGDFNGNDGGYYYPSVVDNGNGTMTVSFTSSKSDMPTINPITVDLPESEDGGYYTPSVKDNSDGTMTVSFTASNSGMPDIDPVTVTIPKGKDGSDGGHYSPSVKDNGNGTMTVTFTASKSGMATVSPVTISLPVPDSGGYYTPSVSTASDNEFKISFTASKSDMPPVSDVTITLPSAKDGDDGVGIESVVQTTTSKDDGGDNVITITLTDGNELTFTVKNGSKGNTGRGISKVEKTNTSDLTDTYTITYSDGTTSSYIVVNGAKGDNGIGIKSVLQTTTSEDDSGENIITVTLTDNTQTTFKVKNGSKGSAGRGISRVEKTSVSDLTDTYTITYTDGTTSTFTVVNGKDGNTPVADVDYPSIESIDNYIAAELAKRNQFVPIPAASVEGMTDTTKIYYLTATGELYAYMHTQVMVGGYTNLADPASSDWKTKSRLNASSGIVASAFEGSSSFVSNEINGSSRVKVYIKGVTRSERTEGTATQFGVALYDSNGTLLNSQPLLLKQPVSGSGFSVTAANQCWNAVTVTEDGVYVWELGKNNAGNFHENIASFRVSGLAVTSAEDIIITVGQEIKDPEIVTEYAWAGTGHFISSEEAITALESRVNVLEDEVEELTVTVDRLKTNSSISMQSGARWAALGDSITEGYASRVNAESTTGYDLYKAEEGKRWVDYVAALNGYTLTNLGIGGTGWQYDGGESSGRPKTNARELCASIDFSEFDLVTFAYGINDFKYSSDCAYLNIGSMDDDIETGDSVIANVRYCIQKVLADNPYAKIFIITPLNCKSLGNASTRWGLEYRDLGAGVNSFGGNGGNLTDLYNALKDVCEHHCISLIDNTFGSVVNIDNISTVFADGVHPTEDCHKVLGYEMARKIQFA